MPENVDNKPRNTGKARKGLMVIHTGRLPRRCAPRNDRISWPAAVIANAVKQSLRAFSH